MGNNMNFEEESVNFSLPLIAMSLIDTDSDKFAGLTFGVSAISADLTPQVRLALGTRVCKFPHLTATLTITSAALVL